MSPVISNFIAVALGGAIGSMLRYAVSLLYSGTNCLMILPTLTVNVVGSFFIGLAFAISSVFYFHPAVRVFLFVGVFGGFTTFSSYSLEIVNLLRSQDYMMAISSVMLNNVCGFIGALLGIWLGYKMINLI